MMCPIGIPYPPHFKVVIHLHPTASIKQEEAFSPIVLFTAFVMNLSPPHAIFSFL